MPVPANLVHETTTGTGTGNLTIAQTFGKQRFSTAFGTGGTTNVFDYFIAHRSANEWEYGTGHMSDATTLVRESVFTRVPEVSCAGSPSRGGSPPQFDTYTFPATTTGM